jgi:hypothetical protein
MLLHVASTTEPPDLKRLVVVRVVTVQSVVLARAGRRGTALFALRRLHHPTIANRTIEVDAGESALIGVGTIGVWERRRVSAWKIREAFNLFPVAIRMKLWPVLSGALILVP